LTVTGTDIEGVVLAADAGGLVAGRVVTDTGGALPSSSLRVTTTSATYTPSNIPFKEGQDDGLVAADGRFSRKGASGRSFIRVQSLPPRWALKSVAIGDKDVTDLPSEIRSDRPIDNVIVVVSNHLPAVTGKVTVDGSKTTEGTAVLFPVDSARWSEYAGSLRAARTDTGGTYRFDNVRPGEYFLIALGSVLSWQVNDPQFLESLRERATRVTVGDAAVTTDLRVIR